MDVDELIDHLARYCAVGYNATPEVQVQINDGEPVPLLALEWSQERGTIVLRGVGDDT